MAMFGNRLRNGIRGVPSLPASIGYVLITSIVGGVIAGLAVLANQPALGVGVFIAAIVASLIEFTTLNSQPDSGQQVPLKTLVFFVAMAVLIGAEDVFKSGSTVTAETIIAGAAVGATYLASELAAWLKGSNTPPTPPASAT